MPSDRPSCVTCVGRGRTDWDRWPIVDRHAQLLCNKIFGMDKKWTWKPITWLEFHQALKRWSATKGGMPPLGVTAAASSLKRGLRPMMHARKPPVRSWRHMPSPKSATSHGSSIFLCLPDINGKAVLPIFQNIFYGKYWMREQIRQEKYLRRSNAWYMKRVLIRSAQSPGVKFRRPDLTGNIHLKTPYQRNAYGTVRATGQYTITVSSETPSRFKAWWFGGNLSVVHSWSRCEWRSPTIMKPLSNNFEAVWAPPPPQKQKVSSISG